jgi:hypothetical protein
MDLKTIASTKRAAEMIAEKRWPEIVLIRIDHVDNHGHVRMGFGGIRARMSAISREYLALIGRY